jgi:hypothetical protein
MSFHVFYIINTNLAVWPFGRLAVLIKFLFYSFVSKKNFCTFANETETLRKCQLTKEEFLQLESSLIFRIGISNDSTRGQFDATCTYSHLRCALRLGHEPRLYRQATC